MECIHGIDEATCTLCRSRVARQAIRGGYMPAGCVVTEAGYDSRCPGCGGFIAAGERIYKPADASAFECETCLVDLVRRMRPASTARN